MPVVPRKARRAAAVAAIVFIAPLLAAETRAATATWTAEKLLAGGIEGAANIRIAVNSGGRAAVVWDQMIGFDATHPYGIYQVYAAVRASATGKWSAPAAISGLDATNAGAIAAPGGAGVQVFWNEGTAAKAARSTDAGATWKSTVIPAGNGYSLVTGNNVQVGPGVGVDGVGNVTVILRKPRPGTGAGDDLEAMVRGPAGGWKAPVLLTGTAGASLFSSTRLRVLNNGAAFLNYGFTTVYRTAGGVWRAPQVVNIGGGGTVYSASADMDANGKAYFVFRTRYGGSFLSASAAGAAWTTPVSTPDFDTLGSNLWIAAASSGHALVYGNDMNTGNVLASATGNGGASWTPLADLGFGDSPQAAGASNGLFALGWSSAGANFDQYAVATGKFLGAAPRTVKLLSAGFASGTVAITAMPAAPTAQIAASWARQSASAATDVAAASAVARP